MKFLFLDHDGVMVTAKQFGSRFKKQQKAGKRNVPDKELPVELRFDDFDRKCVKVLNEIIEAVPGLNIVISSDWQIHATLSEMGNYYLQQGVIERPWSYTPLLFSGDDGYDSLEDERVLRIMKAVNSNIMKPTHWVAVDDLNLSILPNFVRCTKVSEGIKQSGIKEKILEYLI